MIKLKRKYGFTLVEIVVVIAIIGILAGVTIPSVVKYIDNAKDTQDETTATNLTVSLNNAASAIGGEIDANGDYTSDGSEGGELDNILNVAFESGTSLVPVNSKFVFILELESSKKEEKNTLTVRAVNTKKWKREQHITTTDYHPLEVLVGHDCINREFVKSRTTVRLESYSYKGETILGYNITGNTLNEYSRNYDEDVAGLYSFDSSGQAVTFTPWINLKGNVVSQDGSTLTAVTYQTANSAELVVDDSVTKIGDNCFSNGYALERVQLPSTLTNMGLGTFIFSTSENGKLKMDRIYYAGTENQFKKVKFENEKSSKWLGISGCAEIYCSDGVYYLSSECYFILHFDDNGADLGLEDKTIRSKYATHIVAEKDLPEVSRVGYTFVKWTINGEDALDAVLSDESTTTVVANWSLNTYTVSYHFTYTSDVTAGTVTNSNSTSYNVTKDVTLAAASDGTCVFNGWSFDEDGKEPVSALNLDTLSKERIDGIEANGNVINLYGHFAGKVYYTVNTYNAVGTQTDSSKIEKGTGITLPASLGNVDQDTTGVDTTNYAYNKKTWNGWNVYAAGTSTVLAEKLTALSAYTPTQSVDIKPNYTVTTYVKITISTVSNASFTASFKDETGASKSFTSSSGSAYVPKDTSVDYTVSYTYDNSETFSYVPTTGSSLDKGSAGSNFSITASYNATIGLGSTKASTSCIEKGTKITMADGSLKNVEDIKAGDMLLVFNHETGKLDAAPVVFNEKQVIENEEITYLTFSNGTVTGIKTEHGFFDLDLNKYVYITEENATSFIGHRFCTQSGQEVSLTNVRTEVKTTEVYSPVTAGALNYYTNGMLSMPGGIDGMFNIFEYDENMKYDEEKMNEDLATYGEFTYDDFEELIPEDVYEAFNGRYLKVAIGKGMISEEQIAHLAEIYSIYWED